jgi:hypothetical protein
MDHHGRPEVYTGDPTKLARVIFDTTRDPQPPLRLTLGADAYNLLHTALRNRLDTPEAQQEPAHSVAFNTVTSPTTNSQP